MQAAAQFNAQVAAAGDWKSYASLQQVRAGPCPPRLCLATEPLGPDLLRANGYSLRPSTLSSLPSLTPCLCTQMMLCNASWPLLVFQDANFTAADVGWLSLQGARCGCIAVQPFSGYCGAMVCFQAAMPCPMTPSNQPAPCEASLVAAAPQKLWSGPPPSHHCSLMLPTAPSHCKWTFSRPTSASRSAGTARCAAAWAVPAALSPNTTACTQPCHVLQTVRHESLLLPAPHRHRPGRCCVTARRPACWSAPPALHPKRTRWQASEPATTQG